MKKLIFAIGIFLATTVLVFGQDWSPFYFNKKILYGTPDTIGGILVGQSLALVRFDTIALSNGRISMFCKKGLGPDQELSQEVNAKSLVSLYGKKIIKEGHYFWFYSHLPVDSIQYNAKAEPGQIAISSGQFSGLVVAKNREFINNGFDSVKVITITEIRNSSETYIYTAKVSKRSGFLCVPSFFSYKYKALPLFSYFSDYDQNTQRIKSYLNYSNKFKVGDVIMASRHGRYSSLHWSDSIKTRVLSISGDSCFLLDSVKTLNLNNYSVGFYSHTRKILNYNFNQQEDPNELSISSQIGSWASVSAFASKDFCIFVGYMPCNLGLNDNQIARLTSTQFPIFYQNNRGMFDYNISIPFYFQRGDTIFGEYHPIIFTSVKEASSSPLLVYPNPASDRIFVKGIPPGRATLSYFNIQGKEMFKKEVNTESELDVESLPKGFYHIQIRTEGKNYSGKFIKE